MAKNELNVNPDDNAEPTDKMRIVIFLTNAQKYFNLCKDSVGSDEMDFLSEVCLKLAETDMLLKNVFDRKYS